MAATHQQPNETHDPDWIEFESLLGELSELSKSDLEFEQLAKLLLNHTVHILAAAGGAVWHGDHSTPLRIVAQTHQSVIEEVVNQRFHAQVLELARLMGETVVVPPGTSVIGTVSVTNPTELTLLVGPLRIDRDVVGIIEIAHRPSCGAAALRGSRRLIGLVCELASDHLRRSELRLLRDDHLLSRRLEDFANRIHASLNLKTVAYELANSGRQLIDCDRVSVLIRKGRRFILKAISSTDSIDRRSNVVRRLEQLAYSVAQSNEAIWYDGERAEEIAPQVYDALQRYSDEAHPRMIGLLPLVPSSQEESSGRSQPVGVLVVEQFNSTFDQTAQRRVKNVATQSGLALTNALRYERLPTIPLLRKRNALPGQPAVRLTTLAAAIAVLAALGSLFFVSVDFNVRCEGELQPELQQFVFAPFDGQVATLSVKHGDHVSADDLLLELRSPEIDLEIQRIQGEIDTTQQRITAIESSLLQMDVANEPDENRYTQLSAEKEELAQVLASQQNQLALLQQQRDKLSVRSPMAGQILTWELEQLLSNRPVQRGQSLLNVADLQGPWIAKLEVPDDQIGHVLEAQADTNSLPVTFQLATNRGIDYHGTIRRVSSRTEVTSNERSIVRITMDVDEQAIRDLRPGATIYADIHCGQRSLAYVWFHDVVDAVLNWLKF